MTDINLNSPTAANWLEPEMSKTACMPVNAKKLSSITALSLPVMVLTSLLKRNKTGID